MRLAGLIILFIQAAVYGQVRISEPIQHLGDVFESKGRVSAFFELINPYYQDTILIDNILTPCGCTAVLTKERIILPRSKLNLEVAYNPENRPGLFSKSIRIETITGKNERNSIYLKIRGNVVAQNPLIVETDVSLKEYKVVPLYFFPITAFDTSYLDFNFFISFINDLSYEIDFYQFTTLGFEIEVDDYSQIEELENLMAYSRNRIRRGFAQRGFPTESVFFERPVFKEAEIPVWASARVKMFSVNFNTDELDESIISVTDGKVVDDKSLLLNYQRFRIPSVKEVMDEIDFNQMEAKLFVNGKVDIHGRIFISRRSSFKKATKLSKEIENDIFSRLKKSSGISKKNCSVSIDTIGYHPDDKIKLVLWDKSDEKKQTKLNYTVRSDKITPPLLPTYKQTTLFQNTVDQATREFRRFWNNVIKNQKAGYEIKILVESSVSKRPDERDRGEGKIVYARNIGLEAEEFLSKKFEEKTGRTLDIEVVELVRGPEWNPKEDPRVYDEFEYLNLVPIVHNRIKLREPKANPYQVNFDFFFNGVDTSAFVFNKFSNYICKAVQKDGFIKLRIESSISQIPIEKRISNLELAYNRSAESQKRLKEHLKRKLVDPNRIIFVEERNLMQGPEYDGKTPVLRFRPYQYIRIIPDKSLRP